MEFNSVLISFASHGMPPLAENIKFEHKGYRFSPLFEIGYVYTADVDLWPKDGGAIYGGLETFYPTDSAITRAMTTAEKDDCFFVMALTQMVDYVPIGSLDVCLPLSPRVQVVSDSSLKRLAEVGFDVVDMWSGISALTDIGYCEDECMKLKNMRLTMNKFGLFGNVADALVFADFSSLAAPEHAPFIPVKVYVRFPSALANMAPRWNVKNLDKNRAESMPGY